MSDHRWRALSYGFERDGNPPARVGGRVCLPYSEVTEALLRDDFNGAQLCVLRKIERDRWSTAL
jgi:hypothetical protein